MAESSPKWKRPSDIMKIHRKKKRLSQQRLSFGEKQPSISDVLHDNTSVVLNTKRRNPFTHSQETRIESPSKRRKSEEITDDKAVDQITNSFFAVLENANKKNGGIANIKVEKATENGKLTKDCVLDDDDEKSQFDFIEKFLTAANKQKQKSNDEPQLKEKEIVQESTSSKCSNTVPVDWTLKVKLRVVSKRSLLWCTQIKTAEEATGVTDYVTSKEQVLDSMSAEKSQFQNCCLYWIYPSFPWLKLFPRIVPDSKIRSCNTSLLHEEIQSALQNDWTESFSSTFHQLRAQKCPYFYLCSHHFTVLFRAAGIAGQTCINAFLSPTTRGFREALKNEDIEFSMPVLEKRRNAGTSQNSQSSTHSPSDLADSNVSENCKNKDIDDDEDDDDFLGTDEGASVWLESIGLDKKHFPSLDPKKVKIQREGFKVIDNRPESLVCVQGANVQGLFNYLLNCRSCVASSGPQAGVPPTILSPTPFKGATLKSHKVKHSFVKQTDPDGSINQVYILEISGPVLPHHVHKIKSLFKHSQDGNFTLTFNTHEPTLPFNAQLETDTSNSSSSSADDEREKFQMSSEDFDTFFDVRSLSENLSFMRELYCTNNNYTWAT